MLSEHLLLIQEPAIFYMHAVAYFVPDQYEDLFNDDLSLSNSCYWVEKYLKAVYGAKEKFKIASIGYNESFNFATLAYPFYINLDHIDHQSSITCLSATEHIYMDYYEETDRRKHPEKYPHGNFNLFNMNRERFLEFMDRIQKDDISLYQEFIGPMHDKGRLLQAKKYLERVQVNKIHIYRVTERFTFSSMLTRLYHDIDEIKHELEDSNTPEFYELSDYLIKKIESMIDLEE